jgi:hypothetical protein
MKRLTLLRLAIFVGVLCAIAPGAMRADSGHARIVRLSLVQGDVRFAAQFHKDSLEDSKATWEIAPLNLPIREGYALATDQNGRAEVEFENGAMAFLGPNTLVEFYDLSLDDGARITRLILRQGSGIFYVNPAKGDYFSVTGGDFSVEAAGRTRFRLDNYDDGSNVNVEMGQINVLRDKVAAKTLQKGQSYSVNINAGGSPVIGRAADDDDFDKWVSGRIDAVATATAYSSQYVSSPDYTSGFADLYNYGSFYNIAGYGYGWQPYGMGFGWDPFSYGSWYSDPIFGFGFIGSAPWGWLPYHYGGWIFSPIYGWVWMPTGFGYGGYGYGYGGAPVPYRPVTGVYVRSGTTTGLVPMHPADANGKTPLNLEHGIYAFQGNTLAATTIVPAAGEKWTVVKNPPKGTITPTAFATTSQPTRVSRTILSGNNGSRSVTLSRDSSIVYDAKQHSFVNNGNAPSNTAAEEAQAKEPAASAEGRTPNEKAPSGAATHTAVVPDAARGGRAPARPQITPPAPPSAGHPGHAGNGPAWEGNSVNPASAPSSSQSSSSSSSAPAGHSGGGHH